MDGETREVKEVIDPAVDDNEVGDEADQPSESSSENDQAEDQSDQSQETGTPADGGAPGDKEPEPVDGESVRERAMRFEIERLKGLVRTVRSNDIFPKDHKVSQEIPSEVLKQYNTEEVEKLRKVMGAIGEELGWVRKDETEQEILDQFVDDHPEYSPLKDKDNLLWNQFVDEMRMYARPKNLQMFRKILVRVHERVAGPPTKTIPQVQAPNQKTVAAQQHKVNVASHGGRTVSSPHQRSVPLADPNLKTFMKGFDDKELEEIFGA